MAAGSGGRVGDAEREAAAAALGMHFAVGRLTRDEFEARLSAVYAAGTAADLARATADLPAFTPQQPDGQEFDAAAGAGAALVLRRAISRVLAVAGLLVGTMTLGAVLLVAALAGHGGLLVAAVVLLAVPVALAGLAAAAMVWVGRRAWRSGAWLEAAPAAAGAPWMGGALRAARMLLVGRVWWRIASRLGRPARRGSGRGGPGPAPQAGRAPKDAVWYQSEPGGPWRQARVGDLSGTSR